MKLGAFAFYGTDQGLTPEVSDVSADEGGNVYVAAGAAVFARRRDDRDFARFDAATSGFTQNCHDAAEISVASPTSPAAMCPVISVAGATAGRAVIGFRGVGSDYDYDAEWARASGGADLVTFDGASMARERHVFIASPPGVVCEAWDNTDPAVPHNTVCAETWSDSTWMGGRKGKGRVVHRIVVNHDATRPLSHGDVLLGSTHAVISILVARPAERRWIDYTKGDPAWAETSGVWEHEHPAISSGGRFLTGESTGLALDPIDNVPWFSNQVRTAALPGYASATMTRPSWNGWWGELLPLRPFLTFFGSAADMAYWDQVSGLSFCDDGTLWVASSTHGLARVTLDRAALAAGADWTTAVSIDPVPLPASAGPGASAVACDPSDGSVWVGFSWGGFARHAGGTWRSFAPEGAPAFAGNPVRSIQIDRWASPRIVYLAHVPSAKLGAGGVTVYAGP